jgi:hypothetical protein
MPSPEGSTAVEYSPAVRAELLGIARAAISGGLASGQLPAPPARYSPVCAAHRATFVTLTRDDRLRGCIGALEAVRPLAHDVARAAWLAAFDDPRFPALTVAEIRATMIEISVLSPLERVDAASEHELLQVLVPGVDGLVIAAGSRRATFLPKVWEALPSPSGFLQELRRKAGLPAGYWSAELIVHRYRTETFGGPLDQPRA